MAEEIERKYLVTDDSWKSDIVSETKMMQGYVGESSRLATVRVRVAGDKAFLTLKGPAKGISRDEYEYEIPVCDALEMLQSLCGGKIVEKTRFVCFYHGKSWEVDVFHGANEGLVTAEIELEREDETFDVPPWIGEDVSFDRKYRNAALAVQPYSQWKNQ